MAKKSKKTIRPVTPEEAVRFLEDFRTLNADKDELTIPINLRVPGNVLRAVKLKAKIEGKKYQSLIVEFIRQGLSK